jgi:hypothetical protein
MHLWENQSITPLLKISTQRYSDCRFRGLLLFLRSFCQPSRHVEERRTDIQQKPVYISKIGNTFNVGRTADIVFVQRSLPQSCPVPIDRAILRFFDRGRVREPLNLILSQAFQLTSFEGPRHESAKVHERIETFICLRSNVREVEIEQTGDSMCLWIDEDILRCCEQVSYALG